MRDDFRIPDLTFPAMSYGKRETPWDLNVLLYKGGAKARRNLVGGMIAAGKLGDPLLKRLDLVQKIHEVINDKLVAGGRPSTATASITCIRFFVTWAEENDHPFTLDTIQATYLDWGDSLVHRHRFVGDVKEASSYGRGATVGPILDEILSRKAPLIELTRLRRPPQRKTANGVQAEKQNLQGTFEFGHLLQDICDGLPFHVTLKGPLPVRIPLRLGGELVEWSGYARPMTREMLKATKPDTESRRQSAKKSLIRWAAWESDGTLRTRYPLVNLRIRAELLMFIGQTGMNLAQAYHLKLRNFFYASYLNGYQVKDRKHRKGGEVLFEIFKDYKPHFERYLDWRRQLFPDSERLFPIVHQKGASEHARTQQHRLRSVCKALGVQFVPPSMLRNTRVNWLLRRSGDPDLTAEMAQHTKETLLGAYERPSQQRAMGEVMRFWAKNDPFLTRSVPAAPGECDAQPVPVQNSPKDAPEPDCIRPSGCLWCEHHRDIDSQDYVWSLACFRHLKIIEFSKWHPPLGSRETHPAEHAINRISEKLHWFDGSNAQRRSWVVEALARVEEGMYHRDWQRPIEYMEGGS